MKKYPKRGSAKEARGISYHKKIKVTDKLSKTEFDDSMKVLNLGTSFYAKEMLENSKKKVSWEFTPGFKDLPERNLLQSEAEKMAEAAARTQDQWVRDVLRYGDGKILVNPTRWFLFKLSIKRKIQIWRIALAEWIGGEELHEHCDYD